MARSLALLALLGASVAQSTVDLLIPFIEEPNIEATVIGQDATMTTYALACATDAAFEECALPYEDIIVSQGPSAWGMEMSMDSHGATYIQSAHCVLDTKNDLATCSASVSGKVDGVATSTTTADMTMDFSSLMVRIPIVATETGVQHAAAAAQTDASASEATSKATPAHSSSVAEITPDVSASPSETTLVVQTPGPSSASKAPDAEPTSSGLPESGAGMVAQNVFLAGMAALVGGAMML
jgi:hypothetical protein